MNADKKEKGIEAIHTISANYLKALQKITERRQLWNNNVREVLYTTLCDIKEASQLKDLSVQKVNDCENLEAVNIGFNASSSGLRLKEGSNINVATKYGGCLAFSQTYNGTVFVFILYPYIEEYIGQVENKLLATHEPGDITYSLVLDYFEKFINEMIEWEIQDRKPIGYK